MARTADQEPPSQNTLSHESARPRVKMLTCHSYFPFSREKGRPHTPFCVWQVEKRRSKGKRLLRGLRGNKSPILVVFPSAVQWGFLEGPPFQAPARWPGPSL